MKACRSAVLLVWSALLGGCTFNVEPDNRIKWDVEPLSVGTLKAGQAVALKNGYASADKIRFKTGGHTAVFDQQQFTNWAIEELARGLEKQGIKVDQAAEKVITLRVRIQKLEVQSHYPSPIVNSFARAGLEASFAGDGEAYFEESNPNTRAGGAQGAMQLAVLLCLKALGADPKFVGYINR